jgi:hypothetical protein
MSTLTAIGTDVARPRRIPLLLVAVAIYALCAALISPTALAAMLVIYGAQMLVLPILLILGLLVTAMIVSPRAPLVFLLRFIRPSTVRFFAIVASFCVGLSAFTTLKLAIPTLVPFYADPVLADIDYRLHGGNPGDLAHMIVPSWAEWPLGWMYGPMWFILWFGLAGFVALHDSRELRRRYFWTMALAICVIGSVLATLLSSVGPVLYREIYGVDRFAGLMAAVDASAVGSYMREAVGYLYTNYQNGTHGLGTGISAMPSVHLAMVTLNANMLTSLNRWIGVLAWLYVAVILFESVYLGWHYAIDGYVSIALVSLFWWLTGRIGRQRRDPAPVAAAA